MWMSGTTMRTPQVGRCRVRWAVLVSPGGLHCGPEVQHGVAFPGWRLGEGSCGGVCQLRCYVHSGLGGLGRERERWGLLLCGEVGHCNDYAAGGPSLCGLAGLRVSDPAALGTHPVMIP